MSNMCTVLEISKRAYYKYRNSDDSDCLMIKIYLINLKAYMDIER